MNAKLKAIDLMFDHVTFEAIEDELAPCTALEVLAVARAMLLTLRDHTGRPFMDLHASVIADRAASVDFELRKVDLVLALARAKIEGAR